MLKSPMLGANVNTTLEPAIAPYVKNHIIVERKGRKIGIIGILLRTVSHQKYLLLTKIILRY